MLTREQRNELIPEIKTYFLKERDEEIGDLAAGLLLDFIMERLAPEFYNRGVPGVHRSMKDTAEDLLSIQR